MALANLSIYYIWNCLHISLHNKYKISNYNDESDLPDRSYSISDIEDYFE